MLDAGPQEVFNSWGPWSINKYLYMSELYFQLQFVIIMIFYSLNASVWFLSFKDFTRSVENGENKEMGRGARVCIEIKKHLKYINMHR